MVDGHFHAVDSTLAMKKGYDIKDKDLQWECVI